MVTPSGTKTTLHTFSGENDGAQPATLIRDKKGDLYGVTAAGGPNGGGTIFELVR
jgi:hypothetical protein